MNLVEVKSIMLKLFLTPMAEEVIQSDSQRAKKKLMLDQAHKAAWKLTGLLRRLPDVTQNTSNSPSIATLDIIISSHNYLLQVLICWLEISLLVKSQSTQ